MKIAVDIDDTLSTVQRAKLAEAYIKRNGLPFEIVDPYANKFVRVVNWQESDAIEFIRNGGIVVYTDAPARKGAKEALTRWREQGHKITILTARPKEWFVNPERISRDWLQKRRIPYDHLVAECSQKGEYCLAHGIDVLIDDDVDNCVDAQNHGVYAVLAAGKHCLNRLNEVEFSATDWAGIERCIEEIARRKGMV